MKSFKTVLLVLSCLLMISFPVFGQTTLMLYTSVPIQDMTSIQKAFEEKNPDISLEIFRSGAGTIQTKLATEIEMNNIVADVIWVADFSYYETLRKQGLLAQVYPEESKHLPEIFKDKDNHYFAGRLINMVIAYNTRQLTSQEAPKTWLELNDPRWFDSVVVPNPNYSGAMVSAVGGLIKVYGWEYFEDMRKNEAMVVSGNSDVAQKVASGEIPLGMTLDYIARGMRDNGSPIDIVYPEDGTIAIPSPIAVMEASRKKDAATRFINYILSKEGQEVMVREASLVPVRSDVDPPTGTQAADSILSGAMEVDWGFIEENLEEINERFVEIMLF